MKKFMKFCGITALILIVTGFVIAVVAGSIKGPTAIGEIVESVTRGKVHVRLGDIRDWGVTVGDTDLTDWMYDTQYEIKENMDFVSGFDILTGNVEESFDAAEIKDLDIELGACEMEMKASPDENFHLKAENAGKLQGFVRQDTLNIKAIRHTTIGQNNCRITLYVPEGFHFAEADVELGAGVLEFEELDAGEASFEVGAGQIVCSDSLKAEELTLEVGMGEIQVDGMDVEQLDAEVGMGSLILNGGISEKADVDCSMGSIEMTLNGSEEDYNYNLESAMGSVEIGSYSVSGLAGEKKINNKAARDITMSCSMGSIEINFTE